MKVVKAGVNGNLLVVEDYPDFQTAFEIALRKKSYGGYIVDSCQSAIELVGNNGLDLSGIISDYGFRYFSGGPVEEDAAVEFLAYLIKHRTDLPIILTSDNRECERLAKSVGLTFVSRDVGFEGLVEAIEKEIRSGHKIHSRFRYYH